MNKTQLEQYWQVYLATLPTDLAGSQKFDIVQFGDNPELADELGNLVLVGIKTATCSALWQWEAEGEALPEVGSQAIVLDGKNQPLCIIEITEVAVRPYMEVNAEFAYDEGEGDRSLNYWREAHWQYFSRVLPTIDKEPTPEMLLVCERFRVVYK
jgi:uncharacterized protein YhfF